MEAKNDFWKRFDEKRGDKTLQDVCNNTGILVGTIKNNRSSGRLPSLTDADKIAKYLNTTVDYLLNGETDQFTPLEREFIGKFRTSPRDIKTLIEQVVNSTININNSIYLNFWIAV